MLEHGGGIDCDMLAVSGCSALHHVQVSIHFTVDTSTRASRLAHEFARNAVEGVENLDMPIGPDPGMSPGRDVERLLGQRLQGGQLVGIEHLDRAAGWCRGSRLRAPARCPCATVGQVSELFFGEEVRSHVGDTAFDAGFAFRAADPG